MIDERLRHRPDLAPRGGMTRRQVLRRAAALGAWSVAVARPVPAQSGRGGRAADLVLLDGEILTQDPVRPRARAMAVRDGLVLATGTDEEVRARVGPGTRTVELGGRTVVPGLNDSHLHPTRGGRFYALELRWDGVASLETGLNMIAEQAGRTPEGQWVRVIGGWSPFQFAERRLPTPAELTRAAPDVPVYVLYLYSRGFLNARAVDALGLTPDTEVPPGTRYELTSDGGAIIHAEPNPDLLYATIGALPGLDAAGQTLSTHHFYAELARFGLTSVIDAGGGGHRFPDDYAGTDALARSGELSVRVSNYLFPQDAGAELAEFRAWTRNNEAGRNLAVGLAEGYVIEGGGEFLTWSAGDFENFLSAAPDITTRPGWRADLLAVTRHLLENRWPLRVHATYDASIERLLDVFEEAHALEVAAGRRGFGAVRWAVDHAETVALTTLARIAALGGGVAMQARMAYAGEYFVERYGAAAARRSPPLAAVRAAGLPLGLGSDGTRVASYNPWMTLYWATTGRSVGGTELHGPLQRLTREQALYHHTVGSAWFSREDVLKGRLKPGQFADFAVLNAAYLEIDDEDLRHVESELTVLAGEPTHGAGEYADLAPELAAIAPAWSPVSAFGGYAR